jgi:hypothetical protein
LTAWGKKKEFGRGATNDFDRLLPATPGQGALMIPFQRAALGTLALAAASFATPSYADAIPPGWEANNMEPVGYSGLDNRKGAFKMAIKKVNGRWYLYMGHLWPTAGALWMSPTRRIPSS